MFRNLSFVVISLILTYCALELTLRIYEDRYDQNVAMEWDKLGNSLLHVRSSNPNLIYELRPNARVPSPWNHDQQITTNSTGFRDSEFSVIKDEKNFRIIVIGDSVTFGWNVPMDQTYPKLLEKKLKESGRSDIEVYNMGVGGYDTFQEIQVIKEKAVKYKPDLFILGYVLNDNQRGNDNLLWWHFYRSGSRALDFLIFLWYRMQPVLGFDTTPAALSDLAMCLSEAKVPLLFVIFPYFELDSGGKYPYVRRHQVISQLAREKGFIVLDLYDTFQREGFDKVKADLVHPNKYGLDVTSQAIFEFLSQSSLITLKKHTD